MRNRPHFILLGGFLGAGKTTAAARLAEYLTALGLRATLVTNDQGRGLVDTATLRACNFRTEEIQGGCVCCRFDKLIEVAGRLPDMESSDVFIVEAVGSCTDLAATVLHPLLRLHGDSYTVAPLSVLVDPVRAQRILGLDQAADFSSDVRYVFRKQLEEADVIVINKSDLMNPDEIGRLRAALVEEHPGAEVLSLSLRQKETHERWFNRLVFGESARRPAIEIDYERYGEGEACLGWLNASVIAVADTPFDPDALIYLLSAMIRTRLTADGAEVAHLKMLMAPLDPTGPIALVNLVRSDLEPEFSRRLNRRIAKGRVLINVRAEVAPEALTSAVKDSLFALEGYVAGLCTQLEEFACFRPGKPTPIHRDRAMVPMEKK